MDTLSTGPVRHYQQKLIRFGGVSVVSLVLTELLLVLCYNVFDWPAWVANGVAVTLSSVPAYYLSRAWVWNKHGPHSMLGEVLPFWASSLLGLILSTVAVAVVANHTASTLAIMATNIAAFGALWIGRFLLFEYVLFRPTPDSR